MTPRLRWLRQPLVSVAILDASEAHAVAVYELEQRGDLWHLRREPSREPVGDPYPTRAAAEAAAREDAARRGLLTPNLERTR